LDAVDPGTLTDDVLRQIWQQVRIMRDRRMAHRDLRLANVLLDDEGRPWIIDYGFSELAVKDYVLADDVAAQLASTALVVGAARAVAAAAEALTQYDLAAALHRMVPDTFSGSTRSAMAHRKGLLVELRDTTREAARVAPEKIEHLDRVTPQTIVTILALAGAVYFLAPEVTNLGSVFQRVRDAAPGWSACAIAASIITYVGATLSIMGAVPRRLRTGPTFATQLASSLTNRITPAQLGGFAVNIRYLQRAGVETPVAVSSVGLNSLGGLLTHVAFVATFGVMAGTFGGAAVPLGLPSPTVMLGGAGVLLALVLIGGIFGPGRQLLREHVWPAVAKSGHAFVETARRPGKLLMLLGGNALVTLSYLLALEASVLAFGASVPFAKVGLAYLTASAVSRLGATPGNLGVAEAAYAVSLGVVGLDPVTSLSAVFLFRAATFWLPIIPGWFAYRHLRRHNEV
jgi:undecaprenyl-diphosphatase